MNSNRWFMAGASILAVNALAVTWTTIQHHLYADSNQDAKQVSDAGSSNISSSEHNPVIVTPKSEVNSSASEDVRLEVSPPRIQQDDSGAELALPDVPSLSERKIPSADALRNDPVFDELKKMFNNSQALGADLPDSAGAIDTLSTQPGSAVSVATIEALDRRWEVVEHLAISTRGLIREARALAQQGKTEQASTMLSLATQTRGTILRLIAELPK